MSRVLSITSWEHSITGSLRERVLHVTAVVYAMYDQQNIIGCQDFFPTTVIVRRPPVIAALPDD